MMAQICARAIQHKRPESRTDPDSLEGRRLRPCVAAVASASGFSPAHCNDIDGAVPTRDLWQHCDGTPRRLLHAMVDLSGTAAVSSWAILARWQAELAGRGGAGGARGRTPIVASLDRYPPKRRKAPRPR